MSVGGSQVGPLATGGYRRREPEFLSCNTRSLSARVVVLCANRFPCGLSAVHARSPLCLPWAGGERFCIARRGPELATLGARRCIHLLIGAGMQRRSEASSRLGPHA